MVSVILEQKKDKINKIAIVGKALKKQKIVTALDMDDFILELCNLFLCCERKAKEYIKIAKWKNENN